MLTKILDSLKLFGQKVCDRNTMPCGIVSSSAIISRLNLAHMPSIEPIQPPAPGWAEPERRDHYHRYDPLECKVKIIGTNRNGCQIEKMGASSTSRIRFLKWQADCCTGMELDDNTTEFITGPFGGCTFFMSVSETGRPIILHSNSNQFRNNTPLTLAEQLAFANGYLRTYHHPGAKIQFTAEYDMHMKHRMGWVVGAVTDNHLVWQICYVITEPLKPWQKYCFSLGTANLNLEMPALLTSSSSTEP